MTTDMGLDLENVSVLVADDDPNNLRVVESMLEQFGWSVRVCRDGEAAIRSATASPPDVIVLDIHMPNMDGYEACRRLGADDRTRGIPVIFASAMDSDFNKVRGFEAGAVDYVAKPCTWRNRSS